MYIAMNRFRVKVGDEEAFEEIWRSRDSKLLDFDGFVHFDLVRGAEAEGFVLYASHAVWRDKESFIAWTKSEQFRASHNRPKPKVGYAGPPVFEGFETVEGLSISA
ncbi:MAG: antibiotic biosynthesis monooxygenase [Cohaesibacter sp.]|jgi:heme-degrading monooxygenase HmoA|nr:antibiotic biosynthesis monooxygenase [Cohaesibacter sp.]